MGYTKGDNKRNERRHSLIFDCNLDKPCCDPDIMIGAYSVDLAQKIKKQSAGKINMFLIVNAASAIHRTVYRYYF